MSDFSIILGTMNRRNFLGVIVAIPLLSGISFGNEEIDYNPQLSFSTEEIPFEIMAPSEIARYFTYVQTPCYKDPNRRPVFNKTSRLAIIIPIDELPHRREWRKWVVPMAVEQIRKYTQFTHVHRVKFCQSPYTDPNGNMYYGAMVRGSRSFGQPSYIG
jgi:hypothetical protein